MNKRQIEGCATIIIKLSETLLQLFDANNVNIDYSQGCCKTNTNECIHEIIQTANDILKDLSEEV